MSASLLTAQELFGLFELDPTGKVLYYRIEPGGGANAGSRDTAGYNFYDEVAPFENTEEFRSFVIAFTSSAKLTDTFNFDCRYQGRAHRVQVLIARIREGVNSNNTKSVLLHFKQAA